MYYGGVLLEEKRDIGITVKKNQDFSEWYTQTLLKSNFIDYTDVSGALAFRPAAYFAWQSIMHAVDSEFKKDGIEDVYFPLLIPEKLLELEKEHFSGFIPEVAWVTEAGNTKFNERLAIRPTSETIMYVSYSKWIRSWRDLPMRYNQWNSVLRWEFKHPTPFIRSREFLWNEGHSVFATEAEAITEKDSILNIYLKILKEYAALPGIVGRKSDSEKFAGAVASYSIEHVLPDGMALQGPDFHHDGQNFAKAFEIKFLNKEGEHEYAYQNTYAITTRELGVVVATHGDDKGLILPPRIAYLQIVVVPIYKKEKNKDVQNLAQKVLASLSTKYRVKLDGREEYSAGYKFNEWEMRGVPLRIEIGEREVESGKVVLARRDNGEKSQAEISRLEEIVGKTLDSIHENLYSKAESFLKESVHDVTEYEEFKKVLETKKGILHAAWCGSSDCEHKVKEETGAKITNIPTDQGKRHDKCIYCGKKAKEMANFAKSY